MNGKTLMTVILAAVAFVTPSGIRVKGGEVSNSGLIGIQYGSEDFSDPQNSSD